jgi:LDH2 family malate/lactate/ureidoglycolate dehydrogenase
MGHLMGAIQVEGFRPSSDVQTDMESTFAILRESAKAPGHDRIYIHGEPEAEAMETHLRDGVPVTPAVKEQLDRWAGLLDVDPVTV